MGATATGSRWTDPKSISPVADLRVRTCVFLNKSNVRRRRGGSADSYINISILRRAMGCEQGATVMGGLTNSLISSPVADLCIKTCVLGKKSNVRRRRGVHRQMDRSMLSIDFSVRQQRLLKIRQNLVQY